MKSAALTLPLLLALPGAAEGKAPLLTRATEVAPARTPPAPETWPMDGAFVYQPDPRCAQHGVGLTLPDLGRAVCMRSRAADYIAQEVGAKRIVPGPAFTQCNWAWPNDNSWASCVGYAVSARVPEIRFGQSPFWTRGSIGNEWWEGCAAGVAYYASIRVSLHDLPRSYDLVSWETANSLLRWLFDRGDLGDGSYVSAATNHAAAQCGN